MQDEALQAAFEIKTECDEISRRLLRWHWEQKPGSHSLDALLRHIAQRKKESPDYYDRMPDLSGKTSWQQLDTTLCMRVLLDPEKDAAKPLDLLGNTAHPAAARRACNAVRTARNEAAHATDRTDAAQAAAGVLPAGRGVFGPGRRQKAAGFLQDPGGGSRAPARPAQCPEKRQRKARPPEPRPQRRQPKQQPQHGKAGQQPGTQCQRQAEKAAPDPGEPGRRCGAAAGRGAGPAGAGMEHGPIDEVRRCKSNR